MLATSAASDEKRNRSTALFYHFSEGLQRAKKETFMKVIATPEDFRSACNDARANDKRVGFVPTMGALHEGHLSLVTLARSRADFVCASIFVNPTQFGPNEDFSRYPRDLDGDAKKLASVGTDLVFAPDAGAMYVPGEATRVRVNGLTDVLCGPFRPGHFEGVTTVVAKLFALAGPCVAVFGRKDYQQLAVLRRMTKDLFLPIEIAAHPIVREPSGLALSSRNAYLSEDERRRALGLSRGLARAAHAFATGERSAGALRKLARDEVERNADSIDYVDLCDADSLAVFANDATVAERALVAIACRIGKTRLIDNMVLGEDPPPAVV
jgi:pantoate--beta-alanine ligase